MTIIYGIILLGFLVFIHELGHFVFARMFGVEVESFSIGMGPVILHKKRNGTDFRISLFPFGGYCGMKGEKDNEFFDNPKDSLYGVNAFFRSLIGFAGPLFNFIFAVASYALVAFIGYSYFAAGNTVKIVTEEYPQLHSAAKDAGILTGDRIISMNQKETADFSDIYSFVASHADEDIDVEVLRNGEKLKFIVHTDLDKSTGEGKIGVMSDPSSLEKRETKRYGILSSVAQGFIESKDTVLMTFKGISLLFKGVKLDNAVSGPVRITSMLGTTAKNGFSLGFRTGLCSILQFMALISISLFLMNLLPIPILDGWLVFSSLLEAIFKIRLSSSIRNTVQFIGMVVIFLLFAFALVNDFNYFWSSLK